MKKLLSLPPNLVDCFHDVTGLSHDEWFCTNDPIGKKLGSGGGSSWLLQKAYEADCSDGGECPDFAEWLGSERRLLLHAGGQGRRVPAYAPSGKILTPIPVFRWERGQKLSQDLLSLQVPFYEQIMNVAPKSLGTMIVSGDVLIRSSQPVTSIPEADVVCFGLWLGAETATNHGVFVSSHDDPSHLEYMLQKPSVATLARLLKDHFYLTDIGIWLLSDRAVKMLVQRSLNSDVDELNGIDIANCVPQNYDLYSEFGCALGKNPTISDEMLGQLSVAVVPLQGGEFYHFGTTHEIVSSTLAVQNLVSDQRQIMHHSRKPHPSIFIQNAIVRTKISAENHNVWIENSCVGDKWTLKSENVITGVPMNDWTMPLSAGDCIDIVPFGEAKYVVRPYGYNDKFRGSLSDADTLYLGRPFAEWARERGIDVQDIQHGEDIQKAKIFPVVADGESAGVMAQWMLFGDGGREALALWQKAEKQSADEISMSANMQRLVAQRRDYRNHDWQALAANWEHSVFYQTDLSHAAKEYAENDIPVPEKISPDAPLMIRIHDSMFRSELYRLRDNDAESERWSSEAFRLLREGMTEPLVLECHNPKLSVYRDQIVWGRSPVRVDLAGGWTDTPPYCLIEGGNVINMAILLNGQPPLQTYIKPSKSFNIVLRSIDLGAIEVVSTYEELADFCHVGSPFSIPNAALALAGFLPGYCVEKYPTLEQQLRDFGCGIEITLLSAIPAGSGLGTSSMLAATVLSSLNDFCALGWDKMEIGRRTMALEQLLTTGGGWQDQFGGLLHGVKLMQTTASPMQTPTVRWLPSEMFTLPEYRPCHLLYYTGITRTAKTILAEIVRRMFLNQHDQLSLLRQMKAHTLDMYEAIQQGNFERFAQLVGKSWRFNQALDSGSCPPEVENITRQIDDYCLGYKLPGAGGGGYLYMIAKDAEAAARIKKTLTELQPNPNARFVDITLSTEGTQVSRS